MELADVILVLSWLKIFIFPNPAVDFRSIDAATINNDCIKMLPTIIENDWALE